MKVKITSVVVFAFLGIVFAGVDLTTPRDAYSRLSRLSKLFQKFGISGTFTKINGLGSGNHFDDGDRIMRNEFNAIKTADPTSYIMCVQNSKVVVHQRHPSLIGKNIHSGSFSSAIRNMHSSIIQNLSRNKGGIVAVSFSVGIPETIDATTGKPIAEQRRAYAAHSKYLLGKKNKTGQKFYCAVID